MKYSVFLISVLATFAVLLPSALFAQQGRPDMNFGELSAETFGPAVYSIDSSANAVYLFDRGAVNFDPSYNNGQGFSIVFERHTRIRLLHKSAFGLATFTLAIPRKSGATPFIENFKGATYNLEDGRIVATKLDKSSIFKDHSGGNDLEKVVFPNVKEGSVIEYSFRVIYPGYRYIPLWNFQCEYPELWSEYDITVPQLYDYAVKNQGYQKYVVDTTILSTASFSVTMSPIDGASFHGVWSGQTIRRIWALQDVPALDRPEPYTTTLRNHLNKVEFQLSGVHMNGYDHTYRTNWNELTDELMKGDHFGVPLTDHNRWLDEELKKITAGATTSQGAVRKIFTYVRDHFDCSNAEGIYMSQSLKQIWADKKGNVADINLLLTVLCRHAGVEATPVILSSRAHGLAVEDYPLLSDYNYTIVRVRVDGNTWLLDASKPYVGFGQLPELCYNGWGRAIDNSPDRIPLWPDSVTEDRSTTVLLSNTDSGYTGVYTRKAGVFESMSLRRQMRQTKPESFFESLHKTFTEYEQMGDYGFDSLDIPEQPVTWHYKMKYNFTRGMIYFNPIFHERFNANPFNSPVRHYPVEMPFCIDNSYALKMDIPKGYKVDQLPRSQRIRLEDSTGFFEYLVESDSTTINFRMLLHIKKTYYGLEEYQGLRDFFALIVNKEKEPFVFKKINQP
jgi:hypothetical protein